MKTMKEIIEESHKRSYEYGLNPDELPVFKHITEEELFQQVGKYKDFLSITSVFGQQVLDLLSESGVVIIISDDENCILEHFGDERVRRNLVNLNIVPGAIFDEENGATNAVFLANLHKKPITIVGEEHFHTVLHNSACYCVPFDLGFNLTGTIGIMTPAEGHSNFRLALIESMIQSITKELELRRNNLKQKLVHDILTGKTNNGVVIIDSNGNITDYNKVAEKIIGISSSEIVNNNYSIIKELHPTLKESIETLTSVNNFDVKFHHNNKTIYCSVDIFHIIHSDCYKGTYIQLRDETEKKELEQQVIISDRFVAIGKLAAGLAHEIRNPLTSAMGFMQILTQTSDYNKAEKYIPIIYDELKRVKDLISDFVMVSKPSAPNKSSCSLKQIIDETVAFMDSQAILKNVRIKSNYSVPEDAVIEVDCSQIKQVLINTIQNAIEAIEQNEGEVIVGCEYNKDNNSFIISVKDTGSGMDEDQLKNVATPFFTTKDNGTGLGMAVCYRIIESHDGQINISSQKGIGTKVDIALPC